MKISGAQIIVECLKEQGVDTVFGYPGGTILPLYDALRDSPVRHILTVHEQGAAHAADGYARASGRTGVCIATSGPGATNLVTGLAAAFMDSVPVVAITGQVPISLIGRDAFQEVDITGITMPITKHNFLVKDAAKLAETLRYAFRIAASGRPGPVLVDVPRDIQTAEVLFEPAAEPAKVPFALSGAVLTRIDAAAEAIGRAERPVIIVGGGAVAADASAEAAALAEKLSCPVVCTLMGLGAIPASHPLFLGLTGMHGHKPANNCIHDADLIIAVGSRFSDRVTGDRAKYAAGKTLIHIDVDPAEIDKNVAAGIGLTGDMKTILSFLAARVSVGGDTEAWWEKIAAWQVDYRSKPAGERLTAPGLFAEISAQTTGLDCIFATDVGQHQMWAAQHLKIETPRTWLTSGGLGAMGFGLPAAMGAQAACPGKRVIHIAGDGGFKMTGAELYTIAVHRLPVISVIVNNNGLGMIRQLQHAFFDKRYTACELPAVDFTAFAAAFGIPAATADTPREFAAAFAAALAAPGPRVIVANIAAQDLVTPMVPPGAAINAYLDI
ncbi:biosynthetic-type acetolactate synthase large subunit [Anaeroselena agilis]|uniref:Acetolactate synthase n=1 Tax=Anaeroselena agilis TaxID=3063788 RepID=A0ABU3P354_9FIRM|nr:biosynthetic-type acetolactate synthase large subunit [Selenomonadales bacterium 4137-cl]